MQTSQIKTCNNCQLLNQLMTKLDKQLWEIAEQDWVAKKYNLQYKKDAGLVSDLLHYKRILSKMITCSDYLSCFSVQDIAGKLLGKLTSAKRCLCFRTAPLISTTTTTSTTIL